MPGPKTSPCGGTDQPSCPPVPAAGINYTLEEVKAHGWQSYLKGRADERMIPHPADDGPKSPVN